MPGLAERRSRLHREARQHRPEELPYYLSRPRGQAEPAAGWYWRPPGFGYPVFLGANHVDAELRLREFGETRAAS